MMWFNSHKADLNLLILYVGQVVISALKKKKNIYIFLECCQNWVNFPSRLTSFFTRVLTVLENYAP